MVKELKDFPGYSISDQGEVFNKDGKMLATQVINSGYRLVHMRTPGGRKAATVHRLVAKTFIPTEDLSKWVNHRDGNKLNNSVDNLEWMTPKENIRHAFETKLMSHKGEKNALAKLKDSDVPVIRKLIASGELLKNIGKKYGVHYSIISHIKRGKIWTHV